VTIIVTQLVVSAGLRLQTVAFRYSLLKQELLTFLKCNKSFALFRKSLEFPTVGFVSCTLHDTTKAVPLLPETEERRCSEILLRTSICFDVAFTCCEDVKITKKGFPKEWTSSFMWMYSIGIDMLFCLLARWTSNFSLLFMLSSCHTQESLIIRQFFCFQRWSDPSFYNLSTWI